MKKIMITIVSLLLGVNIANGTQVRPKELNELIKKSDYIVGGKIIKVDMTDKKGNIIIDEKARTGPRLGNTIRLHLKIDKKLILKKSKNKKLPRIITIDLWQDWHYSLGQIKKYELNKKRIFLLKGNKLERVYPRYFIRNISEKKTILKSLKPKTNYKSSKDKEKWPKTVKEAVANILSTMNVKNKKIIKNTKKDDLIKYHHGWGMGIRNEFGLWRGNKALMKDTKANHPDDASMVIIKAVWEELQK
jgi:hypothetical protein